jgi:hypothetical protein
MFIMQDNDHFLLIGKVEGAEDGEKKESSDSSKDGYLFPVRNSG